MQIDRIEVSVERQELVAFDDHNTKTYRTTIATATNGVGQEMGSECTPLGSHRIRAKIGHGLPLNTVFIGRRATGEIYSPELSKKYPKRDWILTRILWLCGNQVGFNRGGTVDTQRRFIYIHGAPDSHTMGQPSSHGCIKMRNSDLLTLFEFVRTGTEVNIIQ